MATLVVKHHVRDYATFRPVYDSADSIRRSGGVIAASLYREKGDPNSLLITHQFATMAEAETFVANPALADAMRQAGVEGAPHFEFYEDVR